MAISNASNQIVKVNLIPGIIPSVLHLSQYDTGAGRPITFSVYDGSQAFAIPSGVSIAFEGTKPDGNGFSFTCSKSGSNALLTNYTNQMTALPGKIMCQLVFTDTSGGRVGSLPVLMVVSPAGINGDTVISDSDIEAIVAAQNQYAVLNARLDAAISAATQDSEVQDIRVKADGTTAASAGNAVREQITELKNDLDENVSDLKSAISHQGADGTYPFECQLSVENGNYAYSNGVVTHSDSPYILRSSYVDITMFDSTHPFSINVPDGLQVFAVAFDTNTGNYQNVASVTAGWIDGSSEYVRNTTTKNYLLLKVRKAPDGKTKIVPEDANSLSVSGYLDTKALTEAYVAQVSAKGARNVADGALGTTKRTLNIHDMPGKNLFDIASAVKGYYSNNKFNALGSTGEWSTVIIDTKQYKTVTLSGFPTSSGAYTAYLHGNSPEKFIKYAWLTRENNGTHIIPDEYRFVAICWKDVDNPTQMQVEFGDTATEFEPFGLVAKSEILEYTSLHLNALDAHKSQELATVKAQPMYFAIIDDDTNTTASVQKFHDICVANGVVGGYACEARHIERDSGLIAMLQNYENDGFGCYLHCYNQAAKAPNGKNAWDIVNRTDAVCLKAAEADFNRGLRTLNGWGLLDAQTVWVVPGGVPDTDAARAWVRDMSQRRGFRYAINADPKKPISMQYGQLNNRYNVPRYGLTSDPADNNTAKLKAFIDSCVANGDSMIIMTHTGMWSASDDAALTVRFNEVVQYAISKGMINLNPLELLEKKYQFYAYHEMR